MFFQNVLHHWALLTIYVVLIVLTSPTINDFWGRVLGMLWYRKIQRSLDEMPKLSRWIGWAIIGTTLLLIRFLAAPLLWITMILTEGQRKKREAEKYRQQQEVDRIAKEKKDQENLQRSEARKQWFVEHPPKLYYNTVSGITAVQLPSHYEASQKDTKAARLNGFWEAERVLRPYNETLIFVTKQGNETIQQNIGDPRYYTTGWVAQLHEVVEAGNVELIRAEEIFVPFVNQSLCSFEDQKRTALNRTMNACSHFHLIERQAPREMLPI